ncbi:fasciclin domain-containing protein [Chitinophaga barathri]|uniref:Fasciclin domain-containing protein n=1 Tax=Chitinophaga barathri TaxID=1647451 RepID=A0A3N4ME06_9BACT|nr:fasciclin domain-containing protein [Chitinophaga barathri]RPD42134.1 fasciclin domain-containing protein [Chitinophaga barathri]
MKIRSTLLYFAGICLLACGCNKDKNGKTAPDPSYTSRIPFVLQDNFTFDVLWAALNYADMQDSLLQEGPYTLLAAHNDAFALFNQTSNDPARFTYFITYNKARQLMQYSILSGILSTKAMPLQENKAYLTHLGTNVYISKYLQNGDTIVTMNGIRLKSLDNPASNGLIQVLSELPNVENFPSLVTAVRSDTSLSLFSAAMKHSGLTDSLDGAKDAYTLLPPINRACMSSGTVLASMERISQSTPEELKTLLRYHIIKGRYFTSDLFRAVAADPSGITMQDGGKVGIGGSPTGFNSIRFTGTGNDGMAAGIPPFPYQRFDLNSNIPAGNGVMHKIDRVLIP